MSFGERNWHGIFAGQGYVRVWAGRPGSDNPRENPPKEFLYHPFTLWKSIICRIYWEEWTSWGRCWWKWLFSLGKTRCAFFSFTMVKVIIGRFSNRKWAKPRILPGRDPILSTQRIPRGRDPIISTQRLPRGRDPILSTQRFSGLFWDFWMRKRRIYLKKFPAARATWSRNPL